MWESMNSLNLCESALMEFSLFLLCMFSPVEYNAAKSLGHKTVRTLAIFSCIFSPLVYSAAKRLGETAEYMDGTLAIFFMAFSILLCTLQPELQILRRSKLPSYMGGILVHLF